MTDEQLDRLRLRRAAAIVARASEGEE